MTLVTNMLYHLMALRDFSLASYALAICHMTSGAFQMMDWIFSYAWMASAWHPSVRLTKPKL